MPGEGCESAVAVAEHVASGGEEIPSVLATVEQGDIMAGREGGFRDVLAEKHRAAEKKKTHAIASLADDQFRST